MITLLAVAIMFATMMLVVLTTTRNEVMVNVQDERWAKSKSGKKISWI